MNLCAACNKLVKEAEVINCSSINCSNIYHYECLPMTRSAYITQTVQDKKTWKCPECVYTPRVDSNADKLLDDCAISTHLTSVKTCASTTVPQLDADTAFLIKYFDAKFTLLREDWRQNIKQILIPVEDGLMNLSRRLDISEAKAVTLEMRMDNTQHMSIALTKLQDENTQMFTEIKSLKEYINDMEQFARRCNIEIQNIAERENENLLKLICDIGSLLNRQIVPGDIVAIHRVAHCAPCDRPKNIIVQFASRLLRDSVLAAARLQRNLSSESVGLPFPPTEFYINEHLTINNKMIYNKVRKLVAEKQCKYAWIKNSTIYVRKSNSTEPMKIKTEDDLKKLF